jgi:hypothetical protein
MALTKSLENEVEAELGELDWSVPAERSTVASRRSEARMKPIRAKPAPNATISRLCATARV